ncbi:MAG TPA: hypothetical protein VFZ98_13250 [Vicinamibacterales bacterium]
MIQKEARALLPAWTACALAILASRWQADPFSYLGVPAYLIGSAGVGAWGMGHEYADGTVTPLLTLPVPRGRIWAVKLATAAPMLAALAVLAWLVVPLDLGDLKLGAAMFVLPPIVALFVTPWLTMLTRSPLAGAVFTFAALGGSLALSEWIGVWLYGFTNAVDAFRVAFMWWALGGLSAAGAVLGWQTFATLEVREGHDADVQLPTALQPVALRPIALRPIALGRTTAAAPVTRHDRLGRMAQMIVKELRIQQLSTVVAALWALAYVITEVSGVRPMKAPTESSIDVLGVLTAFYSLVLPIVIGSLACAEERHFGTLDGQLLLPMRSSTQWIVKSATALGLAILLAQILPLVVTGVFGDRLLVRAYRNSNMAASLLMVLGVTSISLYVSTVAKSGIRALMGSIAATVAFGFVITKLLNQGLGGRVFLIAQAARRAQAHDGLIMMGGAHLRHLFATYAPFALVMLMVALALPNFRYESRRPAIIAMHAAIMIAGVIAYDVAINVMMALK